MGFAREIQREYEEGAHESLSGGNACRRLHENAACSSRGTVRRVGDMTQPQQQPARASSPRKTKSASNASIIEDGGDGGACALDGDELAYPCVPCTSTAIPRPRARRKMQQALELPNEVRWRLVSRSLRRMRWQQCHIVSPRYPLYFTAAIHRHRLPPLRTPGHHRHLASACRCRHPEQAVPVPKSSPTAVRRTCQNPTLIILPCACRPTNRWRCSGTSACRSNELCLESWETTCCATVTGYAKQTVLALLFVFLFALEHWQPLLHVSP